MRREQAPWEFMDSVEMRAPAQMMGTTRAKSFVLTGAGLSATPGFVDTDIVFSLGALDTSSLYAGTQATTHILVTKCICNVTTAGGQTLTLRVDLSSDSGLAVGDNIANTTEIYGAGATQLSPEGLGTATSATESDHINTNSAGVYWTAPHILVAKAKNNLYLCANETMNADITAFRGLFVIEYTVV